MLMEASLLLPHFETFKVFFGMQSILTILIFVSRQLLCHDICSILKKSRETYPAFPQSMHWTLSDADVGLW